MVSEGMNQPCLLMNQACRGKLSPYGCGLWARGGNKLPFPLLPFDGRELWPFGGEMCPFPLAFGKELWPFDVGEVRPLPLPLPLASSSSSCCVRDFFFSARRMWRSCDPHMSWEEDRGSVTGMGVEDLYMGKPTLRFEDSPRELQRTRTYLFAEKLTLEHTSTPNRIQQSFHPNRPGAICLRRIGVRYLRLWKVTWKHTYRTHNITSNQTLKPWIRHHLMQKDTPLTWNLEIPVKQMSRNCIQKVNMEYWRICARNKCMSIIRIDNSKLSVGLTYNGTHGVARKWKYTVFAAL